MIKNFYELTPQFDSRKSFYGKAQVIELTSGTYLLKSYDTVVSEYKDGKVTHLGKYSATTTRHQREFEKQFTR